MLLPLLALPLLVPLTQDDEEKPEPPTKEQVAAALKALEAAFEPEDADEVAAAVQAAELVPHEDVVAALVDPGLDHESPAVRRAVFEQLGTLEHEDALEALHDHYERHEKRLKKDETLLAPLLRAVALHEDEGSIELLSDDLFELKSRDVFRARVYGLARVRTKASVERLFDLMRRVNRRKVQNLMQDFRLALMVLTHVDQGTDQARWHRWWSEHEKAFEVPERAPKLPEAEAKRWDRYWGRPRSYERQKRRGRRGDDPDDDDSGRGGR